jgi:hypothetical protein
MLRKLSLITALVAALAVPATDALAWGRGGGGRGFGGRGFGGHGFYGGRGYYGGYYGGYGRPCYGYGGYGRPYYGYGLWRLLWRLRAALLRLRRLLGRRMRVGLGPHLRLGRGLLVNGLLLSRSCSAPCAL